MTGSQKTSVLSLAVCATCPWRKPLQGTKHPNGWYLTANLKRLWNGLRTGAAPGMVCHASDTDSVDYGSTRKVPDSAVKRQCAGALQLVYLEVEALKAIDDMKLYRDSRRFPMTKRALAEWVWKAITGGAPPIVKCEEMLDFHGSQQK